MLVFLLSKVQNLACELPNAAAVRLFLLNGDQMDRFEPVDTDLVRESAVIGSHDTFREPLDVQDSQSNWPEMRKSLSSQES